MSAIFEMEVEDNLLRNVIISAVILSRLTSISGILLIHCFLFLVHSFRILGIAIFVHDK